MLQLLLAIFLATGNPMAQTQSAHPTNTTNSDTSDNVPDNPGGEIGHIPSK